MQIRYEITPRDHLEMLKVRFGLRAHLGRILICVAGLFLGVFGYHFVGDAWIGIIVVFAALTLTQIFMPYIIHRRIYHRNPQLFEMRTVTFTDKGVKLERATGTIEAQWSSFKKFKETKNLFLTYQSKDVVGMVPKRAFPSSDDIVQFRNLLASKLPQE